MDERSERISRRFEVPMLVAAVLVIPLLIIEESDAGEPWDTIGRGPELGHMAGVPR